MQHDGGYAEVMIAKASGMMAVPDDLSSVDAAPLLCAGLTTFSALRNAPARAGDLVAVFGVGGLGLDFLGDIVRSPQTSSGCIPRIGDENGATVILSTPKPSAPLNPKELNPGLAPGLNKSPQARMSHVTAVN